MEACHRLYTASLNRDNRAYFYCCMCIYVLKMVGTMGVFLGTICILFLFFYILVVFKVECSKVCENAIIL